MGPRRRTTRNAGRPAVALIGEVGSQSVVIGTGDPGRAGALSQAVSARSAVTVSEAWPLDQAIATGAEAGATVVVLDGSPAAPELRAMADATARRPELRPLVLGPLEPNVEILIALASGAFGYLPSDSTPEAVADAVEALLRGDTLLPHAVSSPLLQHLRQGGRGIVVTGAGGQVTELTSREFEVLVLLRQARSTAEIARQLVVSSGTVRTHVAALMHKLGAPDRRRLLFSENGG
jgi:DNA-binding NarL/FixJ family response regulator